MSVDCFVVPTSPGWTELVFRYDKAFIAVLKQIPGARWDPERKSWRAPESAIPAITREGFGIANLIRRGSPKLLHVPDFGGVLSGLRPYQLDAVQRLLSNRGFLLTFQQRVGKSRPTAAAAATMFASGAADTVVVFYPNSVKDEWIRQFPAQTGLYVHPITADTQWGAFAPAAVQASLLVLGMHYELLGLKQFYIPFAQILATRKAVVLIADEIQSIKNRKAGRTKHALELTRQPNIVRRWGLTGTPMRNYPRDMWAMFDFVQPDSMGSASKFSVRYCAAHMGDWGWEDGGASNQAELAERLSLMSFRLLRSDVAAHLPKSDRKIVLCNMTSAAAKQYKKHEAALGTDALRAMQDGNDAQALAALRHLAGLTTVSKLDALFERIEEHTERGAKVLVFANYHETLQAAFKKWNSRPGGPGGLTNVTDFLAGGWLVPEKRKKVIEAWKAAPAPAVLFANTISSGIGIDLSDAEVAIFCELTFVPADLQQAEARIQDVHLGKRTAPPLYEYLLVRGTIDEAMGLKLLKKLGGIETVTGADPEAAQLNDTLRESGLVDSTQLGLRSEDPEVVGAALDSLRARLLGEEIEVNEVGTDNADREEDDESDTEADPDSADDDGDGD